GRVRVPRGRSPGRAGRRKDVRRQAAAPAQRQRQGRLAVEGHHRRRGEGPDRARGRGRPAGDVRTGTQL
ncbi:MAG: hypothetical protein AVDCRST_MAG41-4495, partial [uncultured Corynebacteriales bacterium]